MDIPIPEFLIRLRAEFHEAGAQAPAGTPPFKAWARLATSPRLWRAALAGGRLLGWGAASLLPIDALQRWLSVRELPPWPGDSFRRWWKWRGGTRAAEGEGNGAGKGMRPMGSMGSAGETGRANHHTTPETPRQADDQDSDAASIVRQVDAADAAALWDRFASRLESLGDRALAVSGADMAGALETVIRELKLKSGIADADALAWLDLEAAASLGSVQIAGATISRAGNREVAFEVDFGLTLCDCAVAETATLVLEAGPRRSRLTSLAPPTHIALVPFSRLIPDVADAMDEMHTLDVRRALSPQRPLRSNSVDAERTTGGQLGEREGATHGDKTMASGVARSVAWITGSSRTADIESVLVRGMHGPATVIVLGISDA